MKKTSLIVRNLSASVEGKEILHGVSFAVGSGEVHVVMGPNGSGKSTLAYALMGHPAYTVKSENLPAGKAGLTVKIGNKEISKMPADKRAKAGLFLAFQSPIAVPGVSALNLLRSAYQELHGSTGSPLRTKKQDKIQNPVLANRWKGSGMSLGEFSHMVKENAKLLGIDESFLTRGIHDGFSGGEKKKMEMLQALTLSPQFAIFDEIDTGLDVDALRVVAAGIALLAKRGTGVIIITHYQRILKYLAPDVVHILVKGKIVKTGKASLAREIEESGYQKYLAGGEAEGSR